MEASRRWLFLFSFLILPDLFSEGPSPVRLSCSTNFPNRTCKGSATCDPKCRWTRIDPQGTCQGDMTLQTISPQTALVQGLLQPGHNQHQDEAVALIGWSRGLSHNEDKSVYRGGGVSCMAGSE